MLSACSRIESWSLRNAEALSSAMAGLLVRTKFDKRLVGSIGGVLAHTELGVDHGDGVEHQHGHDDDDHGERDHPAEKTILSLPAGVAHPVPPVVRGLCHHELLPVSAQVALHYSDFALPPAGRMARRVAAVAACA